MKSFDKIRKGERFVHHGFIYEKTKGNEAFNTRHGYFFINPSELVEEIPERPNRVFLFFKFLWDWIRGEN